MISGYAQADKLSPHMVDALFKEVLKFRFSTPLLILSRLSVLEIG